MRLIQKKTKEKIFFCRIMDEIETANYIIYEKGKKKSTRTSIYVQRKRKNRKTERKKQKKQKKCRLVLVFWKLFV